MKPSLKYWKLYFLNNIPDNKNLSPRLHVFELKPVIEKN